MKLRHKSSSKYFCHTGQRFSEPLQKRMMLPSGVSEVLNSPICEGKMSKEVGRLHGILPDSHLVITPTATEATLATNEHGSPLHGLPMEIIKSQENAQKDYAITPRMPLFL